MKSKKKFDVILNMEIIEHVEDVNFFLESCSSLLKKDGIMFVATLNKTLKSYLFAIVGAEYILRWLPIGTHEWEKFVKPDDLVDILKKYNLKLDTIDGMKLNIKAKLNLPHKRMHKRNFVLLLLFEIEKNWKHPSKKLDIKTLISSLHVDDITSIKQI